MTDIITHVQIFQMLITGGAGLVGVGVGIGIFKSSINQVKEDIKELRRKQSKLRGEDNGVLPVYRTRLNCEALRHQCMNVSNGKMQLVVDDLLSHTKAIKSLDNFARWWMQKEGLSIKEVNDILGDI